MTAPLTGVAAFMVRIWTWLYTSYLPVVVRDARRLEIASDLWELRHDHSNRSDLRVAGVIGARLLFGLVDDLKWSFEHVCVTRNPRTVAVLATVITLMVLTWWSATVIPPPPPIPDRTSFVAAPSPPPPPPPPPWRAIEIR
jgi:hypothetical protein